MHVPGQPAVSLAVWTLEPWELQPLSVSEAQWLSPADLLAKRKKKYCRGNGLFLAYFRSWGFCKAMVLLGDGVCGG